MLPAGTCFLRQYLVRKCGFRAYSLMQALYLSQGQAFTLFPFLDHAKRGETPRGEGGGQEFNGSFQSQMCGHVKKGM